MFQFPSSAFHYPMYSDSDDCELPQPGSPIRTSPDQSLLTAPRGVIVVRHVLLRLLVPRHPPCALSSLTNCRSVLAWSASFCFAEESLPNPIRRYSS
jgi:hypothetical protein